MLVEKIKLIRKRLLEMGFEKSSNVWVVWDCESSDVHSVYKYNPGCLTSNFEHEIHEFIV